MRVRIMSISVIFSLMGTVTVAFAETEVMSKVSMSFDDCLASIRNASAELGVAPANIVETDMLRIVRYTMNDGSGESILITCSRPDNLQLINKSK
jgi:hypothetical protein